MTDVINRTDVFDSIDDETTTNPLETAARRAERSTCGTSRRSVLAAAGAIGATALSGCIDRLTGPMTFQADPVVMGLPPLRERVDDHAFHAMAPVNRVTARGTVEKYGVTKEVETDNWGTGYITWADACPNRKGDQKPQGCLPIVEDPPDDLLGDHVAHLPDNDGVIPVAGVDVIATPKIDLAGRTFNPITELDPRDVVRRLRQTGETPSTDQPVVEHEVDGFQAAGPLLDGAYAGPVREVTDIHVSGAGAQSLDAIEPVVYGANARFDGGAETPIAGTLERVEYDGNFAFKATWVATNRVHDDPVSGEGMKAAYEAIAEKTRATRFISSAELVQKGDIAVIDPKRMCWVPHDADLVTCFDKCEAYMPSGYKTFGCKVGCVASYTDYSYEQAKDCDMFVFIPDWSNPDFGEWAAHQMEPDPHL